MTQRAATIITPISTRADARQNLEKLLRAAGDEIQAGHHTSLRLVEGLHFLSFFVVPPVGDDAALLVMEATFDGRRLAFLERRAFLERLVRHCPALLDEIYGYCRDYPGSTPPEKLVDYLERGYRRANLFYVACPGQSVEEIEREAGLRERIAERVRGLASPNGRAAQYVRRIWDALDEGDKELVRGSPREQFWVRHSLRDGIARGLLRLVWRALRWPVRVVAWGVLGLLAWQARGGSLPARLVPPESVVQAATYGAAILAAAIALGLLGWATLLLVEFPARVAWRARRRVMAGKLAEASWVTLRAVPGLFTALGVIALASWHGPILLVAGAGGGGLLLLGALAVAVGAALWLQHLAGRELDDPVDDMRWDAEVLQQMCRREQHGPQNHFVSLTNIKPGALRLQTLRAVLRAINLAARVMFNRGDLAGISSIHFARWLVLPGNQRLLFVTNYDGGWGGYLGEFVNRASKGITAIWGNTGGFPRSFYLTRDGCRDEQRFKCYARASQLESLLWYRRYPQRTVAEIVRNATTRRELRRFVRGLEQDADRISASEFDTWLRRF